MEDHNFKVLNEYLLKLEEYLNNLGKENTLIIFLLKHILQLGQSIELLIGRGMIWQSQILHRSLSETVLLAFVLVNLKSPTKEAYIAVYELHGWYEILELFEKAGYEKHKNTVELKKIEKRKNELKEIILKEFGEKGDENISEKDLKIFVRSKLNKGLYKDAELVLPRFKFHQLTYEGIKSMLKNSHYYQFESNFVHSKFFAVTIFSNKSESNLMNKNRLIKDTIKKIHIAVIAYGAFNEKEQSAISKLTTIANKIKE